MPAKIDYMESEEREADMWTVFEATKAEGVAEGRAAGLLEGRAAAIV